MREYAKTIQIEKLYKLITVFPAKTDLLLSFEKAYGPYPFSFYTDLERKAFKGLGHQSTNKIQVFSKAAAGVMTGQVKPFIPKDSEKRKVFTTSLKETDIYNQGGT